MIDSVMCYHRNLRKFYKHNLSNDLDVIMWLGIIGVLITIPAIIIDYNRVVINTAFVLEMRTIQAMALVVMSVIGFKKNSSVRLYHWTLYTVSTIFFVVPFLMDYNASMPSHFLPNCIIMYLFAFNLMVGHPYLFKVFQTIGVILGYSLYANHLSPHNEFHTANLFNLIISGGLILAAGWLTRKYRLSNYHKNIALDESTKKIESNNLLKTKIISMISHDIASPISNLSGLIHLYKNKHVSEEELITHFENIQIALDGLSAQMNGMLKWTKMQLNDFESVPTRFEVYALTIDVLKSLDIQHLTFRLRKREL